MPSNPPAAALPSNSDASLSRAGDYRQLSSAAIASRALKQLFLFPRQPLRVVRALSKSMWTTACLLSDANAWRHSRDDRSKPGCDVTPSQSSRTRQRVVLVLLVEQV